MDHDYPLISFIIPVRNDAARLRRCLDAVRKNDYLPQRIEIVVADNGSVDDSAEVGRSAGAMVLDLPGLRVSELRNRGAKAAQGDVFAFIDADQEIDLGWSRNVAESMRLPGVAAVGALPYPPPDGTWVQQTYDSLRRRPMGSCEVDWLAGGNLAVRRAAFEELGGFDVGLEACEDVDFCRRLRQRGHRLLSDARLKSIHYGDPRTLRQLFVGELWRGRDNLRVSLRGPISLRELPSIAIPLIDFTCIVLAVVGLALAPWAGFLPSAVAAAIIFGFSLMRTFAMMTRYRSPSPSMGEGRGGGDPEDKYPPHPNPPPQGGREISKWKDFPKAFAVALVYDLARALALVMRAGHHRDKV